MEDGLELRFLKKEDLFEGFVDTLSELSPVDLSFRVSLESIFDKIARIPNHYCWVVIDWESNLKKKVVGTISLYVEQKYSHRGSRVGHIEDLVVCNSHRGKGLGSILVKAAIDLAKAESCRKVILNTSEKNVSFYEQLGFETYDVGLRMDLLSLQ